jgi:biotin carboxylase
MLTILCVATYLKGEAFIRECRRLGATVVLLTDDTLVNADWPRDAIAEVHSVPRTASEADVRRVAGSIARRHRIDRVAALDDFDVETGAMLREFLQVPGFGRTVAARFRDKLMMRTEASRAGLRVPAFTRVVNDDEVNQWADQVAAPWVLKPRGMAAATGIRVIASRGQLWPALESTGDERPMFLLEKFVAGDVYHVDAIVRHGRIVFSAVSKYGRPPIQIAHEGGVFVTRTLPRQSREAAPFVAANDTLLTAFDLRNGVSHSEYISSSPAAPKQAGGESGVTFLETSARVGGAYISDVVEAATGVNLWVEWARLELAGETGAYEWPAALDGSAGIALCLARQESPDLSPYDDPEIVLRVRRPHHAGLIVRSPDAWRIETLLEEYVRRFSHDFLAMMPAPTRPTA